MRISRNPIPKSSRPSLQFWKGMAGTSSWIPVAEDSDFSLQNLPFGVFSTGADPTPRCGVALGNFVVDLSALGHLLSGQVDASVFARGELNAYMACERQTWRAVRERLIDLLGEGGSRDLQDDEELRGRAIISMDQVTMHLPARIGDYTDFFTSRDHAYNCGETLPCGAPSHFLTRAEASFPVCCVDTIEGRNSRDAAAT
jgi:fumarylacetoacetase